MSSVQRFFRKGGAPFTYMAMTAVVVFFLILWLTSGGAAANGLVETLAFVPSEWTSKPWTALTYALLNPSPGSVLCVSIGLYFFCIALEKAWGTARFGWFFAAMTVLGAVSIALGCLATGRDFFLATMGIPIGAAVVAWATRNPTATVLFYFVLPIQARWIAWITALSIVFVYSMGAPVMGPFVAIPFIAAWAYAAGRLRLPSAPVRPRRAREADYEGIDFDKRRAAEQERRKLKDLFERSWKEDDETDTQQNL